MPFSAYVKFVSANKALVGFGFTMAMASSFGQTFFIGVFGPSIQKQFALSHTAWSSVYLIGTLASAFALPWTGKLIDRIDLRHYAVGVLGLLAFASAFMAGAVSGVVTLTIAIFLLRQGGQGLATHVAFTTMTRYFDDSRGKAVAIASMGLGAGEALLPIAAVFFMDRIGWRGAYGVVAVVIAGVLAPLTVRLLRGHGERHHASLTLSRAADLDGKRTSWTRGQVVRDPRFYLLLPGLLAPPLIVTALFFNHLTIAAWKGWSGTWITGNYVVFAASSTITSLACGPLIDRFGGVRLAPVMLLPLAAGIAVLAEFEQAAAVPVYFILIGISMGIVHTAIAALWVELYGARHLGAIRSMVSALAVFASALGPMAMGTLMDAGVEISTALHLFAAYAVVGAVLIAVALRLHEAVKPQ